MHMLRPVSPIVFRGKNNPGRVVQVYFKGHNPVSHFGIMVRCTFLNISVILKAGILNWETPGNISGRNYNQNVILIISSILNLFFSGLH